MATGVAQAIADIAATILAQDRKHRLAEQEGMLVTPVVVRARTRSLAMTLVVAKGNPRVNCSDNDVVAEWRDGHEAGADGQPRTVRAARQESGCLAANQRSLVNQWYCRTVCEARASHSLLPASSACQAAFFDPHCFTKSQFLQNLLQLRRETSRGIGFHCHCELQTNPEVGTRTQLRQNLRPETVPDFGWNRSDEAQGLRSGWSVDLGFRWQGRFR
jgi:hypothetical protein